MIFALIRGLPIWGQLATGASVIALITIAYVAWQTKIYNEGYAAAIADVAAQDRRAVNAVNQALARVRECRDSGRVWSTAAGECRPR